MVYAVSCADDDTVGCRSTPFVFDAWIDSDGYPVVILTRVLKPSDTPVNVSDMLVRWAKVTISDGERTVVMTGGVDDSVFPAFSYRSFDFKGEVGRTYTIKAEYEGVQASAQSTLLQPASIVDVRFCSLSDGTYSGTLDFITPDDADTCRFVVFTRVNGIESRHYPAFMGTLTTTKAQERVSVPFFRGNHADLDDFIPNFCTGDEVDVILARVEDDVYRFYESYQDQVYYGNNIFISADAVLRGNVVGGYGVFSARGVARRVAVVGQN